MADLRESLKEKEGESNDDYAAFLLFAALPPKQRKIAKLSRILDEKVHVTRYRSEKFGWEDRLEAVTMAGEEGERKAASMYADKFHTRWGGKPRELWIPLLAVPYIPPRKANPKKVLVGGTESAAQAEDVGDILQHARARMLEALRKGEISLSIGDFERLQKMEREEQSRKKTEEVAKVSTKESFAQSDRVMRAKATNSDIIPALKEDMEELYSILGSIESQRSEAPNVLVFRSTG